MYSIFQNPELQARYENSLARSKEIADDYMRIGEKKGMLIGEKRGEKKGILIGKKRGEIEGEIGKIQDFKKLGISLSTIYNLGYKHLKRSHIKRILEEQGWTKLNASSIFEALQKENSKIIEE